MKDTLGVILFQEQVLQTAMVLAGFTAGEADLLRRALSRNKPGPEMDMLRRRFISGAEKQGSDVKTADSVFTQLAGYSGYGFCKSHSASFALIAYQSLWLKHYYPAEFACALLNNQRVGLGDAERHGIKKLPLRVQFSAWEYTVEHNEDGVAALRPGLSTIKGMGKAAFERLDTLRQVQPFVDLRDSLWRTKLPKRLIENLIRATADKSDRLPRLRGWYLGMVEQILQQSSAAYHIRRCFARMGQFSDRLLFILLHRTQLNSFRHIPLLALDGEEVYIHFI